MNGTRLIAHEVVDGLRSDLRELAPDQLVGVRSVLIYGSYIRGDWLDANSDLDIAILFTPDAGDDSPGRRYVREAVQRSLGGRDFPSHTPGGIDWCTLPPFPATDPEVRNMGGFFPFNVFLFDFLENSSILWGEDFRSRMPSPPAPCELARPCLASILQHLAKLDRSTRQVRAPFNAYKALQIAQLVFGERTLDKTRLLPLYLTHVPDFPMKTAGEHLIRQYIGAIYPTQVPQTEEPQHYQGLINQVLELLPERGCRTGRMHATAYSLA